VETQILQRVNEVSANLVRTPGRLGDLNSILQHIAQTAQDAFETDACVILAFNPITANFIGSQIVVGDLHVKNELLHDRPRPNGVTQQVLREGFVLVPDLDITPQYHNLFTTKEGFRSFAGIAIRSRHRKRPLGVIYLDFRQPKAFNSTDYERFKIFATQATLLLQETWLEIHLAEVSRIGQEINHNLALVDDLFQELQKYVDNILDDSHSLLLGIYQSQTNTLDLHIREQKKTSFLNIPLQGTYKDVIETQTSRFIPELSAEAEHNRLPVLDISTRSEQKESLIVVPLTLRGEPLGVLSIQHALPKAYGQEDHYVLQLLANYIALALHNIRLYSSLTELNETGQILTQQLESEQTLDATVEKIRDATKADIVVLYPYEPDRQRFVLPPRRSGTLLDSPLQSLSPSQPDDIAVLMLRRGEPIYARESTILYNKLLGEGRTRQGHFAQRERIRSTAVVPLQVGEEAVGVLFVNFRQPQRFDGTQKLLMEGLAHYAAIAIKNSQVFGTLSLRRMRELEALQKIDRELSQALDLSSVLNTILSLAHERVEAEEASILLLNDRLQVLETAAAIGRHAESSREQMLLLHEPRGISSWVVKEKKPVLVNNLQKDLLWRDIQLPVAADIVSELDIPLLDGDEVVGVLNFESIKEGAFQKEDQDFLLTLAGQAVLAIKNGQAYEREKRLAEEGRVLNQISKEITGQLDPNHVLDLILEKALELTHSTRGNLMIYDHDRNDLWMAAEHGVIEAMKGMRHSLDKGIVGHAARTRQLLNVDLSQPPWNDVNLDYFPGTLSELAVPMLAGEELHGVLNVESLSPHNYSERDERLLSGLADLAVIALQNARAFEREKRLVEEGRVLNEISREITSQLDPRYLFDLILAKALELTHSTLGSVHLYDDDSKELSMVADRGVAAEKKGTRQKLGVGIVGYVAAQRRLLNIQDITRSPWNEIYIEFVHGSRSELAVPMLVGDELRGILNVESLTPGNFSERDERLLQEVADLAVIALQNVQAFEREKRLAEERQVLNDISKEITGQLDYVRVFDLILKKTLELTNCTLGALLLYDPDMNDLSIAAEHGLGEDKKQMRIPLNRGIVGYVATHKQFVNVEDVSSPPWNEVYLEIFSGIRSELAMPMLAGDELRGVLNVESSALHHFKERDERLLQGLADLAVVALQNTERYEKARKDAQRFELLYQAGRELSKITDVSQLEQAYDIVLRIAEEQSHSLILIRRFNKDAQELELIRASQPRYKSLFLRRKLDVGINGQVARERRTIVVPDIENPPSDVAIPQPSDLATRSRLVTPIMFEEQYYGNLGLNHPEIGHFQNADILFFEGLAQLLASTIHRLETAQERQEFEQRAQAAEEMSLIGQSAFEVTHRLGNDLGLVDLYISDIHSELEKLGVANGLVSKKLNNISQAVQRVLSFSGDLKQELARLGAKEEMAGEPTLLSPRSLLEETRDVAHVPANVAICVQIEHDVAMLRGIHSLVADILRNLVANAIQAMPGGGTITLRSRNADRYVALEVSDTGVGIAPERQSQIFGLFFSTKGSSGFGLWSARRNALRNHGDLNVESKLGEGTTFTLLLPRTDDGT
jgi:GAF domain-containing protein